MYLTFFKYPFKYPSISTHFFYGTLELLILPVSYMPKLAKTMSAKELGAIISTEGVHSVGGVLGLALRVRKRRDGTFSRTWILRQQRTVTGQQFKVTIGEYPSISLAKARNLATEILLSGENPHHCTSTRTRSKKTQRRGALKETTLFRCCSKGY